MASPLHQPPQQSLHQPGDPFGVYVHWPFCAAKCPYCDFNSHVRHRPVDQAVFVEAYGREIAHMASVVPNRTVSSVFFGGGTPSLMEPDTVGAILEAVATHWTLSPDAEITLEANPSSVEARRFQGYRQRGVNRLSLGVQSLEDEPLKFLGRLHSADDARRAIALARDIFPRLSFDMIYARPGQTPEAWERELEAAIALAADHLSLYQLTIEQGTPFFELHRKGRLPIPDPDRAADLYELTREVTARHGLPAYEISNHAAPGAQCRHNLVYWRYHDYAGIGPGAHGRLSVNGAKLATVCEANPEIWWQKAMAQGHGLRESERLTASEAGDEMLVMGLRLAEGIEPGRFRALSGRGLNPDRIRDLTGDGLIEFAEDGRLRATPAGFMVLDAVVADLAR
ncbi:MAG: coproporphyrinogen III oxidase [Nitratireductor sp.]|nr:coproporphyrinogen III oxidase [Nitratireductor sp.]